MIKRQRTEEEEDEVSVSLVDEYQLIVQNVVCTASAGRHVNTYHAVETMYGKMDKPIFPACVSTSRHPPRISSTVRTVNILFSSGNIVITGAKTIPDAIFTVYSFVRRLHRDLDIDISVFNFQVQNIVASVSLHMPLDLNRFFDEHGGDSKWQTSRFIGLRWATENPKISFVLFYSGNVVVTGMKLMEQLQIAKNRLPEIIKYRATPEIAKEQHAEHLRRNKVRREAQAAERAKEEEATAQVE